MKKNSVTGICAWPRIHLLLLKTTSCDDALALVRTANTGYLLDSTGSAKKNDGGMPCKLLEK